MAEARFLVDASRPGRMAASYHQGAARSRAIAVPATIGRARSRGPTVRLIRSGICIASQAPELAPGGAVTLPHMLDEIATLPLIERMRALLADGKTVAIEDLAD